jgi:hypothetical protein
VLALGMLVFSSGVDMDVMSHEQLNKNYVLGKK